MIAHLNAIKETDHMNAKERIQRIRFVFDDFSTYLIGMMNDEYSLVLKGVLKQMLRSIIITEKLETNVDKKKLYGY